ncbi:MAG: amidohydrolase [Thermoleophilia bacterium]
MRSPELALVDFRIRTLDPERPIATAVAVVDGMVGAVGTDAEVRRLCSAGTEIVEGGGAALVPGLVDTHQHALSAPQFARGADLTSIHTLDGLLAELGRARDSAGDGAWVLGWGLNYSVFQGGRLSNSMIDDAVQGQPCLLRSFDGHTGLATRAALELAGVNRPIEFGDGSRIVCVDGVPTGELNEISAIALVADVVPPVTSAEARGMVLEELQKCTAVGITAVHLMDGNLDSYVLARDLEESGELDIRLVIPVWQTPETSPEETEAYLASRDVRGRLWRGGVVKFFADGVIDTGTGWLLTPDTERESTEPFWPEPGSYADAVKMFADAGWQCATHATGDAAVRAALDAYKRAGRGWRGPHRIEHIETLDDADLPRFAKEGVAASMQPLHMQWREDDASDWWARRLGPERCSRAWRCLELVQSGAIVPLGSDWPVAGRDPLLGMAWARLRREPGTDRPPFEPHQRLSGLQALEGHTTMAARTVAEESIAGRIAEGYRADFTGFAEDPVEVDADELIDLPVVLTVVDGRVVWSG